MRTGVNDGDRVDVRIPEDEFRVGHGFDVRIERLDVTEAIGVGVAHHAHIAVGQGVEVSNQVGAPVAATDHRHVVLFRHDTFTCLLEMLSQSCPAIAGTVNMRILASSQSDISRA